MLKTSDGAFTICYNIHLKTLSKEFPLINAGNKIVIFCNENSFHSLS